MRTLKLRASVVRKAQTRAPLPFESSPELDPQDVQFLEAMRDLRVRRLPGQGGAPVRQEAIRSAHIAADEEGERLFRRAMENMGVAPLGPSGRPQPAPAPVPGPAKEEPAEPEDRAETPSTPAPAPRAPLPPRTPTRRPETGFTRFEEPEDAAGLMEEALRSGVAGLNEKFRGAPAPAQKRRRIERSRSSAEPDDELDLHGTTQEEAIRKVQHFLVSAKARRLRQVLIITGRGLRSGAQGPVLRGVVQSWLERNGGPYVRLYSWAPPRLGGDGAIWVELT